MIVAQKLFSRKQTLGLTVVVFATVALAGCGGSGSLSTTGGTTIGGGTNGGGTNGGGTGGQNTAVLLGRVVDTNGAVVAGATVGIENSTLQTLTLSQGGFRLNTVPSGVLRLVASAVVNGVAYSGSTQVLAENNRTSSNATITLSRSDNQGVLTGTVRDDLGNPLPDARVFVGVFATPAPPAGSGDVASLVGFADRNGVYRLNNIPASISRYTITASLLGFQNQTGTLDNLGRGEIRHGDFSLTRSSNQNVAAPSNVSVQAFTQPALAPIPNAASTGSASGTQALYAHLRDILAPKFAALRAQRHLAKVTRKISTRTSAHDIGPTAVEMDVFFDEALSDSLSGFRIYNSDGTKPVQPYDFLQDPLANFYSDIDAFYVPNRQYNFAVSAVNTDSHESALSNPASVLPLSLVGITFPTSGQVVNNPLTVAWTPVNGASSYAVFLYNQFPGVGTAPIVQATNLNSGATSFTFSGGLSSADYWVVVAASADAGAEISVSQIVRFHISQ